MNIYLAARFSRLEELREYAKDLESMGHTVTSRWLKQDGESTYEELTPEGCRKCCLHDIEDVLKADTVISFTEPVGVPNTSRGGRHVEFGIGLARNKRMLIVGPRENVFHWDPRVSIFDTWVECLVQIQRRDAEERIVEEAVKRRQEMAVIVDDGDELEPPY